MWNEIYRYRFKYVRYLITEENQRSWTSKKYHLVSNFYSDLFLFDKEKYFCGILPQPKNKPFSKRWLSGNMFHTTHIKKLFLMLVFRPFQYYKKVYLDVIGNFKYVCEYANAPMLLSEGE